MTKAQADHLDGYSETLRRCTRCGDLDQARRPVIYDGSRSPRGCPQCGCNEFGLVATEGTGGTEAHFKVGQPDPSSPAALSSRAASPLETKEHHEMPTTSSKRPKVSQAARTVTTSAAPAADDAAQAAVNGKGKLTHGPARKPLTPGPSPQSTGARGHKKNRGADAAPLAQHKNRGADAATLANHVAKHEPGELRILQLNAIGLGGNPRTEFGQEGLQELAESIRELGLLQPMLVGQSGDDLELIAGGRRWRACKLAGLNEAPCYVRVMSAEQVILARLAENLKREDLTPLDEARGYQRALAVLQISQEELARRLSVSQGQISNRLRLLKLPDEWQRKIISGEMTATQARDLVAWVEYTAVLENLAKEMEDEGCDRLADLPARKWDGYLVSAITRSSERLTGWRTIKKGSGNYSLTKLDDATLERLQIVECDKDYRGEPIKRCFNLDLWDELTSQQIGEDLAKEKAREQKKIDGPKGKGKGKAGTNKQGADGTRSVPATLTAAEIAQRAEQHNKRLYRHRVACLQAMIASRVETLTDAQLLGFVLVLAVKGNHSPHQEFVRAAAKTCGVKLPATGPEFEMIAAIPAAKQRAVLLGVVRAWCGVAAKSWSSTDADPKWIEHIAADLNIDFAKEWGCTAEFLQLHTIEQLGELAGEWKQVAIGGSKAERIKKLLQSNIGRPFACPKELLKVKACTLD